MSAATRSASDRPGRTRLSGAVDASGAAVGASDDMAQVLDSMPSDAYGKSVHDAVLAIGQAQALTPEHVALATVFTTQTVQEQTFAMASALRASPPPTLDGEVFLEKVDDSKPNGRISFRGRYTAPEWRNAGDDRWRFDASGQPVVQSPASLEFLLVFTDREAVAWRHALAAVAGRVELFGPDMDRADGNGVRHPLRASARP